MVRRYRPKKEDEIKGTGYDSLLEKRLHETTLKDCQFHAKEESISYSVPHTYEPDFVYKKEDRTYLIETKGRFQDSSEARKYTFVREHLPSGYELVFVWQKSGTAFPFSRRRKDGTRMSQDEWADNHGFRHWSQHEFKLELL